MSKKTVLITGASVGGIGVALAQEFHSRGLCVFATARSLEKMEHLRRMCIEVWALDVTLQESINDTAAKVRSLTGENLDVLVNNAGVAYQMPMLDSDVTLARCMFDTNVFSVLTVTQALAPHLIAAKGTIINIGSVGGEFALVYSSMYNAPKAALALKALSDTMRLELIPFDVKVMAVITGIMRTRIFQNLPNANESETPSLPSGSLYMPIKDAVQVVIDGQKLFEGGVEPREFTKGVVENALRRDLELWFWAGEKATLVWFATSLADWLPKTWFDHMLAEDAGLNVLKKHYQEKAKSV